MDGLFRSRFVGLSWRGLSALCVRFVAYGGLHGFGRDEFVCCVLVCVVDPL